MVRSLARYWRTSLFLVLGYGLAVGTVFIYDWSRTAALVVFCVLMAATAAVYIKARGRGSDRAE